MGSGLDFDFINFHIRNFNRPKSKKFTEKLELRIPI